MAFIELIIISWFYGVDGFFKNVEEMKIKIPGFMKIYWKACWLFITPVLIGMYFFLMKIHSIWDFFSRSKSQNSTL